MDRVRDEMGEQEVKYTYITRSQPVEEWRDTLTREGSSDEVSARLCHCGTHRQVYVKSLVYINE
jgi:hypothetical protein